MTHADETPRNESPESADAAGDSLESALQAAEARADEARSDYLRVLAELDNVRKRAVRDVETAHRYGLEKFATELLGVRDSLELGLAAASSSQAEGLREGMEATLKLLTRAFEQFGVTEIDPVGAPFDPQWHEAMAMQESAEHPVGTVLTVVQKGYQLNGRLLRPARVIVSREPAGSRGEA
jgi:molecular chaperone GrpE